MAPNDDKPGVPLEDALLAALDKVESEAPAVADQFMPLQQQAPSAEHRRSPRLLTETRAEIYLDGQWVGSSVCRNVCETGMFVGWGKQLGEGTVCDVRLVRGGQTFGRFGARVARQTMDGLGLEFQSLTGSAPRYVIALYDRGDHGMLESLFAPAIVRFSEIRSDLAENVMAGPAPVLTPIAFDDE